jgi:hypothetical protein
MVVAKDRGHVDDQQLQARQRFLQPPGVTEQPSELVAQDERIVMRRAQSSRRLVAQVLAERDRRG